MLTHQNKEPRNPDRVVMLGGNGFFGKALTKLLKESSMETLPLSSADLDLTADDAVDKLKSTLREDDSLVIFSALTPDRGRGIDTFMANLKMIENLCAYLAEQKPAHVIYFSSDAVYPLGSGPVNETSAAAPADLYGAMHRSRELMLQQTLGDQLCILRPTLVYGADDSHNSYGPNRFRRQAAKEGKIVIGGEGEETRDHIYIDDIAEITKLVLENRSTGMLNVAGGSSTDFGTVARLVAAQFDGNVEVCPTPRKMPATHRSFDITALHRAFPGYVFTPLETGLKKAHEGSL
ncbi:MAG: NAD(P)-dependent oxidoreductase [Acidobacteriota bacterium]|nr:NAD(P)-dependent oxidoreductase [Acidobacteriota bacterium]